jgi:hypothetical protein
MCTSDLLPDHVGPGAALVVLLATLGAVHPRAIFDRPSDWRQALDELRAVDIRIQENPNGSHTLVQTAPEPGRLTEADRVRALVRQSPTWQHAVMTSQLWIAVVRRMKEDHSCRWSASAFTSPPPSRFGLGAVSV